MTSPSVQSRFLRESGFDRKATEESDEGPGLLMWDGEGNILFGDEGNTSPFKRSLSYKEKKIKTYLGKLTPNETFVESSNEIFQMVTSSKKLLAEENDWKKERSSSELSTDEKCKSQASSYTNTFSEMQRLRKQHTLISESSVSAKDKEEPHSAPDSTDSDSEETDQNASQTSIDHERLHGETEEDAEIRKNAIAMRSRRRSSVVQIPTASIQMDLHTLYLESINGSKKKGKMFEEPLFGRRLQKNSTIYGSFDGDDNEKKGRFALLKQKFKKDDTSQACTLEDFKDFKEHLRSNLVEVSDHALAKYKDAHWSTLHKFEDEDCECGGNKGNISQMTEEEHKRFEALWELFYAEVRYLINNLVVLHDVFAKPLQHAKSFGFLTCVNETILFANLEELIQATSDFANKLLKIFQECTVSSIGRTIEIIVSAFKLFDSCLTPKYNEYSINYQKAKSHLESLKDDEIFQDFLKHCEQDQRCNRRHIEDFLVAPLQHLTKLPLLLKAVRKHSPKGDRSAHLLTSTIFDVEQSIHFIEKKISALMNLQRLNEIQEAVIWPVLNDMDKKNEIPDFVRTDLSNNHNITVLLNPNRQLLQEGVLTLADGNKTECYNFLFDDMLLMTKPRKRVKQRRNTVLEDKCGNTEPTLNRSKKQSLVENTNMPNYVVYKQPLPIDRVNIYDCDDQSANGGFKNAFCVVHFNRYHQALSAYTFCTNTPEEKTLWMKNIKKAKDEATSEGFSSAKDISSDEEYML